jgi:hypothetical protein
MPEVNGPVTPDEDIAQFDYDGAVRVVETRTEMQAAGYRSVFVYWTPAEVGVVQFAADVSAA